MASKKSRSSGKKTKTVRIPSIKACLDTTAKVVRSMIEAGVGTDRVEYSVRRATIFALQGKKRKMRAELRTALALEEAQSESGTSGPVERAALLLQVATVEAIARHK